jgi:hypothetical protein
VAVITNRSANNDKPHRILSVLAAVWVAISLAIGGSVAPSNNQVSPAQAAAREAAGP